MDSNCSTSPTIRELPGRSFFGLPREIRDRIYDLLFEDSSYQFQKGSEDVSLAYRSDRRDNKAALPRWLLTCRQILSEGLAQFYREVECTRLIRMDRLPKHPADIWGNKLHPASFLTFKRVRKFNLGPFAFWVDMKSESGRSNCRRAMMVPGNYYAFNFGLPAPAEDLSSQITNVKITIDVVGIVRLAGDRKDLTWELDANPFLKLGKNYQSAEFILSEPYRIACIDAAELMTLVSLYPKLQRTLLELAKNLTGGTKPERARSEKSWVIQDWIEQETNDWHVKAQRATMQRSFGGFVKEGLLCFTPALQAGGEWVDNVFRRDAVPWAGNISFSCEETGEKIWLENGFVHSALQDHVSFSSIHSPAKKVSRRR